MKIFLIIIIALIIFAAIAFVVFKKMQLKNGQDSLPSNLDLKNRLKNATHSANIPSAHHEPEPAPATNLLATADAHLNNQNYPEAINALKNILMTNPKHQGALIKLLQTYGVTKQYDAFRMLHQKIHEIADSETIKEADFCKSLLDGELNASNAQPQSNFAGGAVAEDDDAVLEFGLEMMDEADETPAPAQAQTAPAQAFETSLADELDLEGFNLEETPAPAPQPAQVDDGLTFDLGADFGTEPAKAPAPAVEADNGFDLDADFGTSFDFEEKKAEPAPAPVVEEETGFDFGTSFDFEEKKAEPAPQPAQVDDGLTFDLGADFGTEPAKAPAPAVEADNGFDLDADFGTSFDFEEKKAEPAPQPAQVDDGLTFDLGADFGTEPAKAPAPAVEADNGFDLDADFGTSFDFEEKKAEPAPQPAQVDDGLTFDLGADFGTEPAKAPAPAVEADNGFDLDADFGTSFDFEEKKAEPAPAPVVEEETGFDFGTSFDFEEKKAEPAPQPAQVDDGLAFDLSSDFGAEPKVEPTFEPAPAPVVEEETGFDFGTSFDFEEKKAEPAPAPVVEEETGFDFGTSFDFEEKKAEPAPQPAQVDDGLAFDLSSDFGAEPKVEPTFEPAPAPVVEEETGFDFGTSFDFEEKKAEPAPQPAIETTSDLDHVWDVNQPVAPEPVVAPAPVATPAPTPELETGMADFAVGGATAPTNNFVSQEDVPAGLDFVSALDNSQITLDLAKQYLEFGEYDSAKHLLNEVAQTGSDNQRRDALELIKRLG